MDMRLEAVLLPVSDVDRTKSFYQNLGWRVDIDFVSGDYHLLQFTPPGSECSILFGKGVATTDVPGTVQGLTLVVKDIEAARADLAGRGIDVGEVYHDDVNLIHRAALHGQGPGPDPERRSYCSFADFKDPDGNSWTLQEITMRLPGR